MRYASLNALNKLTLQFKTLEDEKAYMKVALQQVKITSSGIDMPSISGFPIWTFFQFFIKDNFQATFLFFSIFPLIIPPLKSL